MNLDNWKIAVGTAVSAKLHVERCRFNERSLLRFDIGVFPWHGTIELSLLFSGERNFINDIANWPSYNFSKQQEGKWPEAEVLCKEMAKAWSAKLIDAEAFFLATADALKADDVQNAIISFERSENFCITLFNPDSPKASNYYI